ncbi:hypothetical protein RIF29_04344 [Crotalaria pallida]|uniref:Uncharacterized protein n=1 Tax=Crotalaria pallida TaxID=3830 RepID=A0AAN9P983_CROPI
MPRLFESSSTLFFRSAAHSSALLTAEAFSSTYCFSSSIFLAILKHPCSKSKYQVLFGVIVDELWTRRNKLIFEGKQISWEESISKVHAVREQIRQAFKGYNNVKNRKCAHQMELPTY